MKIQHINHACLLIEDGDQFVLTDPWFISPSFGGWTQNPYPPVDLIEKVLAIPSEKLIVATSHGHDDHMDEFFISHHLKDSVFVVPKYSAPGTKNRLKRLISKDPIELTEEEHVINNLFFAAFIQEDYTNADGIITIRNQNDLCIHANDNWHEYSNDLILKLKNLTNKVGTDRSLFLTQCGIADCYPWNYPRLNDQECLEIIYKRIEGYKAAIKSNINRLGIKTAYSYANQSKLNYTTTRRISKSPYQLVQEQITSEETPIEQLNPGSTFENGQKDNTDRKFQNGDVFNLCLSKLQTYMREYSNNKNIFFVTEKPQTQEDNSVYYVADPLTWVRILIGELTLESISIGGLGYVYKLNDFNSREIHYKLGNFAYMAQSQIRKKGLNYYLK